MKRLYGLLFLALLLAVARLVDAATFQPLGDLLPGVTGGSAARAVSADGQVVVGTSSFEAFRWTPATAMVDLGFAGGATAVSADGSVVVGSKAVDGAAMGALGWTQGSGPVNFGVIPGQSPFVFAVAQDVSADGSAVVGISGGRAFRWTLSTGMADLGELTGDPIFGSEHASRAYGVSGDGSVVVGWSNGFPMRWTEQGGMAPLSTDWYGGTATAISSDGRVIVGGALGPNGADNPGFRWTADTGMVPIPGALAPRAVSSDGSVIVGQNASGDAFYWTEASGAKNLRDLLALSYGLDLNHWLLKDATGVSADGRTIVGMAEHYSDSAYLGQDAWIAHLPEPADFNGDGVVDASDLDAWKANVGLEASALNAQGDADYDGDVDGADLLVWQRSLGATSPTAPTAARVPEPVAIELIVIASMSAAGSILSSNRAAICARRSGDSGCVPVS